jgi:hypothetical protein
MEKGGFIRRPSCHISSRLFASAAFMHFLLLLPTPNILNLLPSFTSRLSTQMP